VHRRPARAEPQQWGETDRVIVSFVNRSSPLAGLIICYLGGRIYSYDAHAISFPSHALKLYAIDIEYSHTTPAAIESGTLVSKAEFLSH
jgi:hypothetical protein